MNRQFRLLVVLAFIVAAAYITGIPLPPFQTPTTISTTTSNRVGEWYPVVRVSDGDTIVIKKDGADVHIRLIGINTPEVSGPYTKEQCFGKEASAETKKILNGTEVRIETDSTQGEYDKYKRVLAYVYAPANSASTGIMINEYLVQEGYAREYTYKKPYKYQSAFKSDELAAKAAKKGLWGSCPSS